MSVIASGVDILHCQYHRWYSQFKTVTIKSAIIQLSHEFVYHLTHEDGIVVPDNYDDEYPHYSLYQQTKATIDLLEGEVCVKFNWSVPLDAVCMNGYTLKCLSYNDIYVLLKSSDRIIHDIENTFDLYNQSINDDSLKINPVPPDGYFLILRKWANLAPSMEFRMFIYSNTVVGISQRDPSALYESLINEKTSIEDVLLDFYENKIHNQFGIANYTIDVYIDRKKRVWIIDFNPFGEPTSSLLYDWNELIALYDNGSISDELLRIVEDRSQLFQSTAGMSRGPIDVAQAHDFHVFKEICKLQAEENDDSDDNEY